jgi:pyruvate kinase
MKSWKRTKIVATLGPSSMDEGVLLQMVAAGLNAVRINTSHTTLDEARASFELVRRVEAQAGAIIAVIFDLQGPKIRLDGVPNDAVTVAAGDEVRIARATDDAGNVVAPALDPLTLVTKYAGLPSELAVGDDVLIGDGEVRMRVIATDSQAARLTVVDGGTIKRKKGIARPGRSFAANALQPHDFDFIKLGCELGVDYFAVSFVRCANDMIEARGAVNVYGGHIPLISKIEQPEAVQNLEELLHASDAVMVARGDLGLFLPLEEVPLIQKRIISLCKDYALPVITATQMLESMIENEYPTRAEVSDVANAILDGTDAVMLSGETATGEYPVHVIEMMRRIAVATEPSVKSDFMRGADFLGLKDPVGSRIANGACRVAVDLHAAAIIAPTMSGYSARNVSRFRPECAVVAPTSSIEIARRLALSYGVVPVLTEKLLTVEQPLYLQLAVIEHMPKFDAGDLLVFIGGIPLKTTGVTNFIKVERVEG